MDDSRKKFQNLLRKLFQFDNADLDFGIYRIMNYKRNAINKFIDEELLDSISAELKRGDIAHQSEIEEKLGEIKQQIIINISKNAFDDAGNLKEEYQDTRRGKEYLELLNQAGEVKESSSWETLIFNHLYTFFNRYYDNGDFLSKRRYSKKEKYAVPYNGEEVYLHWANKDQYYIKTGEYFENYSYKQSGITVQFKIRYADVPQDNIKGDKRFFFPIVKDAVYNNESKTVLIPFEYRPLTEQEAITYGKSNQQDKIITDALEAIPGQFEGNTDASVALITERKPINTENPKTYIEHHLRRYTRRNTSDYFIHKDLKGFLYRELDFYLKNEVLNLDELEAGGEDRAEGWFQIMRVIKSIGRKIIEFLAQIENFQKKLFEKKKFITDTGYCLTLDLIPEEFYEEIAANNAQRQEWVNLFSIHEINNTSNGKYSVPFTVEFLKCNPCLVVDTKHFPDEFRDKLLSVFDTLDEGTST